MKKRTICLLLAGAMALSLLSGCGGDAGTKDKDTQSSAPAATDAAGPAETDGQDAPEQSAPEPSTPAADVNVPRFDHLAVQFHDVVITPGMTLGEALKAIDDSELPLTYPDRFSPEKLKQEFEVPKADSYTVSGTDVTFTGQLAPDDNIYVECDGESVFGIKYSTALPGEPGTTYRMEDLLVLGASIGTHSIDTYAADELRTFLGTEAQISSLSAEEIESIFAQEGAELTVKPDTYDVKDENGDYTPVPVQNYEALIRFVPQWNGYKLYSVHRDGISEGYIRYSFKIDEDGNMLGWSVSFSRSGMLFWTSDSVE